MGCATSDLVHKKETDAKSESLNPIGYLGFKAHQEWALKFNDCMVYDLTGAQPYQWFERTSAFVSCYTFKPNDAIGTFVLFIAKLTSKVINYH